MKTFAAYYLMPEKEFKITNTGEDQVLIYLANCDI